MWAAKQPQGVISSSPCPSLQAIMASFYISVHPPIALAGYQKRGVCLWTCVLTWMFDLVFPQHARQVFTGGAAANAASAKTVAHVTLPQGSVLAPRGGRGWPASWVSNGASAALGNGLWHNFGLVFLRRLGVTCMALVVYAHEKAFVVLPSACLGRWVSGRCFTL